MAAARALNIRIDSWLRLLLADFSMFRACNRLLACAASSCF